MKQAVVAVGLILGFSSFANAAEPRSTAFSNWLNRHDLPFHKTPKGHPLPGTPGGNRNGSNGTNTDGSFSNGTDSNGDNPAGNTGGNEGGSSFGNFVNSITGDNGPAGGGETPHGKIAAPEIDPASSVSALGLLSTALLMLRGRRKKQSPSLT
jgi:hypothetical protein